MHERILLVPRPLEERLDPTAASTDMDHAARLRTSRGGQGKAEYQREERLSSQDAAGVAYYQWSTRAEAALGVPPHDQGKVEARIKHSGYRSSGRLRRTRFLTDGVTLSPLLCSKQ